MSATCPDGHVSESTDYCDVCGQPMIAASTPPPVPAPVAVPVPQAAQQANEKPCPNCSSVVPGDDLFCEVCGYDFTTGVMPGPSAEPALEGDLTQPYPVAAAAPQAGPPETLTWVAEVWIDPDWYATQESDEPCPSAGMPGVVPLRDRSILVGRRSASRNIHPQVDCGTDHGVSRRHAQLTTDGQRWFAEDLQSSNGTFIAPAGAPLPTIPITAGQRVEFREGDRVYVGAWTRLVIRRATPEEQ